LKKITEKIIFMKFVPKRSAQKWTSNKMGSAKKKLQQNWPRQSGHAKKTYFRSNQHCNRAFLTFYKILTLQLQFHKFIIMTTVKRLKAKTGSNYEYIKLT